MELVRILPESPQPNITNIFCNNSETNPSDLVSEPQIQVFSKNANK